MNKKIVEYFTWLLKANADFIRDTVPPPSVDEFVEKVLWQMEQKINEQQNC